MNFVINDVNLIVGAFMQQCIRFFFTAIEIAAHYAKIAEDTSLSTSQSNFSITEYQEILVKHHSSNHACIFGVFWRIVL